MVSHSSLRTLTWAGSIEITVPWDLVPESGSHDPGKVCWGADVEAISYAAGAVYWLQRSKVVICASSHHSFVDVCVADPHTGQQDLTFSSMLAAIICLLYLDLKHYLEEILQMSQKLDPGDEQ